ncbi:uroporphyrinogen-III C-methyltransferase, partial [Burkholderia sp. Ac-20392]|nr:uroporphyrinogen-III C-methyltransferase [Burkholderia sp. Ac-20392]
RWTGTLGDLARGIDEARLGSPAVILVGGAIGEAAVQHVPAAGVAIETALSRAA